MKTCNVTHIPNWSKSSCAQPEASETSEDLFTFPFSQTFPSRDLPLCERKRRDPSNENETAPSSNLSGRKIKEEAVILTERQRRFRRRRRCNKFRTKRETLFGGGGGVRAISRWALQRERRIMDGMRMARQTEVHRAFQLTGDRENQMYSPEHNYW